LEIFSCPKGYGKTDLTDGCHCCTENYAMKGGLTGAQKRHGQPHLVKSLQEKNVHGATSIDEDSVELNVLDGGTDYERIPSWLWHNVWVLGGGGRDRHDLLGYEFLLPPGLI
jgi:hypothetical protein